ncbi:MAG: cupredoxin domain-containing protein, partial [Actinomycetota bacterium]
MTPTKLCPLLFASILLFAGCGGGDDVGAGAGSEGADPAEVSFGAPAEADSADREVEVEMTDALRFEPASIEVDKGETVSFVISNGGKLEHEFVLGDPKFQEDRGAPTARNSDPTNTEGKPVPVPPR